MSDRGVGRTGAAPPHRPELLTVSRVAMAGTGVDSRAPVPAMATRGYGVRGRGRPRQHDHRPHVCQHDRREVRGNTGVHHTY